MPEVIALKPHRYGKERKTGERYTVKPGSDERLVRALGWAGDAPPLIVPKFVAVVAAEPEEIKPKRAYIRRDVVAEPEPVVVEAEKPKRTYHRRDMTATDKE